VHWFSFKASILFWEKNRLGGKRGAGVRGPGVRGTGVWGPGVGVRGCGKHGVWWKTRGVENAGSGGKRGVPCFRQNMNFPQ